MKPLSETYKELGIAFVFPIEIRDAKGKVTYNEDNEGICCRWERDSSGNETYYEDSEDHWYKCEYSADGKLDYYENSEGVKQGIPRSSNTN